LVERNDVDRAVHALWRTQTLDERERGQTVEFVSVRRCGVLAFE
jgi:hypothetical protein